MSREFVGALLQLNAEKQVPREQLIHTIEDAIQAAWRRTEGDEDIQVRIDAETGKIRAFRARTVVTEVADPATEFTIDEAHVVDPNAQVGELREDCSCVRMIFARDEPRDGARTHMREGSDDLPLVTNRNLDATMYDLDVRSPLAQAPSYVVTCANDCVERSKPPPAQLGIGSFVRVVSVHGDELRRPGGAQHRQDVCRPVEEMGMKDNAAVPIKAAYHVGYPRGVGRCEEQTQRAAGMESKAYREVHHQDP